MRVYTPLNWLLANSVIVCILHNPFAYCIFFPTEKRISLAKAKAI